MIAIAASPVGRDLKQKKLMHAQTPIRQRVQLTCLRGHIGQRLLLADRQVVANWINTLNSTRPTETIWLQALCSPFTGEKIQNKTTPRQNGSIKYDVTLSYRHDPGPAYRFAWHTGGFHFWTRKL